MRLSFCIPFYEPKMVLSFKFYILIQAFPQFRLRRCSVPFLLVKSEIHVFYPHA